MKLALSITHAPWILERAASLARLLEALDIGGPKAKAAGLAHFHLETTKGPNWKWGEAQWQWAVEQDADACVFVQDDQTVPPRGDFWVILRAMLDAAGERLIGLHTRHPDAIDLAARGKHWLTTTEMVGTGYVFPLHASARDSLQAFRAWRDRMGLEWCRKTDEDTSIGEGWCKMTSRRIWHPIPTIIDHDTDLASTADNDLDPERRPVLTWESIVARTTGGPDPVSAWTFDDLKSTQFWRRGLDTAPHYVPHRLTG